MQHFPARNSDLLTCPAHAYGVHQFCEDLEFLGSFVLYIHGNRSKKSNETTTRMGVPAMGVHHLGSVYVEGLVIKD